MYQAQQALIKHIRAGFNTTQIRTIEEYAGELKDAPQLRKLCPAVLLLFADGNPLDEQKRHVFDALVITRNRALDKKKNLKNNLELVSDIAAYLRAHFVFRPADEDVSGSYEILRDEVKAATLLNDSQFCIVTLTLPMNDYT